jgi:predicted enzyme related to lactoylglutathione lyase
MRPQLIAVLCAGISLALTGEHAHAAAAAAQASVAVAPQYDTTHVYVAPEDFDRFADSLVATFGGTKSKQGVFQVTPAPSQTMSQLVFTPVGTFSLFGFKTPIPYPFGAERTGYLVTDMDAAVKSAQEHGADITVEPFPDPIGRDAIIEWPGGVYMQLYWHTVAPHIAALTTIPENRVYVSHERADAFIRDFVEFSSGKVTADNTHAPGIEIGRPADQYRSVQILSPFGKIRVLVTDGKLPYPYGREVSGYEVQDLAATLAKATGAGAKILVPPFTSSGQQSAVAEFPGGYIAEIHAHSAM